LRDGGGERLIGREGHDTKTKAARPFKTRVGISHDDNPDSAHEISQREPGLWRTKSAQRAAPIMARPLWRLRQDTGYFGGYVTPANLRENRRDHRLARNHNGKRKVVVIVRERNGGSVPAVFKSEAQAMSFIRARVRKGTVVNADEATSWDGLGGKFEMRRINHEEAHTFDGACTNWAEEFFSRIRRAEIGHHHHIAGAYLLRYAQEASWREDNRRMSNGDQVSRLAGFAMKRKPSPDFCGYWQRHLAA